MKKQDAPRWLWLLLGVGVFSYVGFGLVPIIHCHYAGKESVAVVTDYSKKMEGGVGMESEHQVLYYTLNFDGHSIQKRTSGKQLVGARLPVIYFPDNPGFVVRGSRAEGLWNTIVQSTNEKNLAIWVGIGVFLLLCAARRARNGQRDHA